MAVGMSMLVMVGQFVFLADAVMVQSDTAERDSLQDIDDLIESSDNIFGANNTDDGNGIDEEKIKLVQLKVSQSNAPVEKKICSRAQANNALLTHDGDVAEAVRFLTDADSDFDVVSSCSTASSTLPMTQPLPSGHNADVSKQKSVEYESNTASIAQSSVAFREESSQVEYGSNANVPLLRQFQSKKFSGGGFTDGGDLGELVNDLFTACRSGDVGVAGRVLENPDVDVNKLDANKVDTTISPRPMSIKNREIQKQLLQARAEVIQAYERRHGVSPKDNPSLLSTGITPLLSATYHGNRAVVQVLLKHPSIDVNKGNAIGVTPLMLASHQGKSEMMRLFLDQKQIDVNLKCINFISNIAFRELQGQTALNLACRNCNVEIVSIFRNHLFKFGTPLEDTEATIRTGYLQGVKKAAFYGESHKVDAVREELSRLGTSLEDIEAEIEAGIKCKKSGSSVWYW